MQLNVLEGRECGECHVCCVALTVDLPEFQKHSGCACVHALPDLQCGVYANRYPVCREYECGWRLFKWVRPTLRPDRAAVLVNAFGEAGSGEQGVVIYLLAPEALAAEGLAETVAAAVAAGVPVMVGVPGPPGHTYGFVGITDEISGAVQARDKAAVLDILAAARERGLAVETEKVSLVGRLGPPTPAAEPGRS